MRPSLALLVSSFALLSCRDSSGPSFLELGINALGPANRLMACADGVVAAAVVETSADLNGDGDRDDSFLNVVDLRSGNGKLWENAAISSGVTTGAGFVTFSLWENEVGRDLNGDGDRNDAILHVYDARHGALRNLRLQTFGVPVQRGALIAVGAYEQFGVDLNGDGDRDDMLTHVYEADRRLLTLLPDECHSDTISIQDRRVFHVIDAGSTARVQYYEADTGQIHDLPYAIDGMRVQGSLLAMLVPEWENGDVDLNGNGTNYDGFVELHDLETGHVRVTDASEAWILALAEELAVVEMVRSHSTEVRVYDRLSHTLSEPIGLWNTPVWDVAPPGTTSGRRHAYLVDEYAAGADLDGDGQQMDAVLHVFDGRTGRTKCVGRAAFSLPEMDSRRVAFLGLGEPRNERPPTHTSVHLFDLRTGAVTDLDLMASQFRLVDGRIVALTPEEWQGVDLDGDQALTHTVLQVHDLASGETLDTGLSVADLDDEFAPVVLDEDVLVLVVDGRLKAIRLR